MNVSYRWLQSLAPGIEDAPAELTLRLGARGMPADEVVRLGETLGDVVIGRVESAERHPNADRLTLCRVDAGTGELLSVVCGAPNVRAGGYYPFAPVGASLPGGVQIRKAKIRGAESQGMLCSERELGLGRDSAGIMELHGDFRPGDRFVDAVGLDDVRFSLDIGPNRPDLLSHVGVAREVAPGGVAGVTLPEVGSKASRKAAASLRLEAQGAAATTEGTRVTIEDAEGCTRYIGVVIRGVRVGPAPDWLAARLRAVGLRPINNVVDVTNYVLYELGQPLHAFDLARLRGPEIRVRRARAGESLVTLDGDKRALTDEMLVIADAERPVALAGVMGGQESEVSGTTTDVLLECALFDPRSVRHTRRAFGLSTDASYRFERGVDPAGQEAATRRALELILEVAGGKAAGAAHAAVAEYEPAVVPLRPGRAAHVLGLEWTAAELARMLGEIGFERANGKTLAFRVPGWRSYDVTREVDLIEEIARRHGYDAFPDERRAYRPGTVPDDALEALESDVRSFFTARGFFEARSVPFVPEAEGDVALQRPLSAEESRLRRVLLPGLVRRVEHNFARGTRDVRLFEIGTGFCARDPAGLPFETRRVAAVMAGARAPSHWSSPPETFDVWDLKGLLEELAPWLGGFDMGPLAQPLHDERIGVPGFRLLAKDGSAVGVAGLVPADAIDAPAWAGEVWACEVALTRPAAGEHVQFRALPGFPAIERDLALIVPDAVPAARIAEEIAAWAGPHLESVHLFDLYRGPGVPEDARSLAYRLRLRAPDRTLTDREADEAVARVLSRLAKELGVERR